MSDKRVSWADGMKGLSALMVMLYHAAVQPDVKSIAYLLCLPAFFFVAGLFANTNNTPDIFFRRKTLRLLIPYLVFGVLCWLLWLIIGCKFGSNADNDVRWWFPLWGLLCGKVELLIQNRPLWFLCCMICTEWLYYALCRVPYRVVRWLGVGLIAVFGCVLSKYGKTAVWEITAAMLVLPIYVVGAEGSHYFRTHMIQCRYVTLLVVLTISLIGIGIGYFFNPEFHISTCQTGNPLLFYLTAFSVMGFWLAVCVLLEKRVGFARWLRYFGQNTLIVLCTHIPLYGFVKGMAMLCQVPLEFFTTSIGSIALCAISLALLYPIMYIINRFFPFLIGKCVNPLSAS